MAYIGKGLDNGVRNQFIFAATQGQTAFSGADSDGKTLAISDILYTDCFQNGVKLEPTTDYTVTLTSLTLVNAASLNDVVDIVSFDIFAVPDTVPASTGGTFTGGVTFSTKLNVPTATTAPSSPAEGDIWFNSSASTVSGIVSKAMANYSGSGWFQMSNKFTATGGTVSTYSSGGINYKVHTFTSSGSLVVTGAGVVDYLIVAGGGGGGSGNGGPSASGGGGGAGGMLTGSTTVTGTVAVTIGAGGSGSNDVNGVSGNSSVFNAISTVGGGGGQCGSNTTPSGGSGGGGDYTTGGAGTSGQGNAGGDARTLPYYGGGGGGAGQTGRDYNANAGRNGDGGYGIASSISGSSITYAGGGGSGVYNGNDTGVGQGGLGGGGSGGKQDRSGGSNGSVNTGGGGGGGADGGTNSSWSGGSGIVIVRYTA